MRCHLPTRSRHTPQKRIISRGSRGKMLLLPLIAATYFMVSGGPYGIEDILGGAGYGATILILLALPFVWLARQNPSVPFSLYAQAVKY